MPIEPVNHPPIKLPDWWAQLGVGSREECAKRLADALDHDPFDLIGFTSVAAMRVGEGFEDLARELSHHEPRLDAAFAELCWILPVVDEQFFMPPPSHRARQSLPEWLRKLAQVELTGAMRRYEYDDKRASTYLIESTLPGGHVAIARLSIRHDDGDVFSSFWTMAMTLDEAARFYRKRYAMSSTRPFRHVKLTTARQRIAEALMGAVDSGELTNRIHDLAPWPANLPALMLMLWPHLLRQDHEDVAA